MDLHILDYAARRKPTRYARALHGLTIATWWALLAAMLVVYGFRLYLIARGLSLMDIFGGARFFPATDPQLARLARTAEVLSGVCCWVVLVAGVIGVGLIIEAAVRGCRSVAQWVLRIGLVAIAVVTEYHAIETVFYAVGM